MVEWVCIRSQVTSFEPPAWLCTISQVLDFSVSVSSIVKWEIYMTVVTRDTVVIHDSCDPCPQLPNPITKFDRIAWIKFVTNFYQNSHKTTIKSREWQKLIQNTSAMKKTTLGSQTWNKRSQQCLLRTQRNASYLRNL